MRPLSAGAGVSASPARRRSVSAAPAAATAVALMAWRRLSMTAEEYGVGGKRRSRPMESSFGVKSGTGRAASTIKSRGLEPKRRPRERAVGSSKTGRLRQLAPDPHQHANGTKQMDG